MAWPRPWAAVGWLLTLAVASAALSVLSLPEPAVTSAQPPAARDLFRPEWLVLASFLAFLVRRVARASILLGALALVAASAQVLAVADWATDRLAAAGLTASAPLWFTLAVVESLGFLAAAVSGWRRRWSDRRWEQLTRRPSRLARVSRSRF